MILQIIPMFASCFVLLHATSRFYVTALSGIVLRPKHRSWSSQQQQQQHQLLGRCFGVKGVQSTLPNTIYLQHIRQPPQQHQKQQLSLLSATTDGNNNSNNNSITDSTMNMGIPSMEQLRTDSFMKQVQYAEFITGLIEEDNGRETDVLMNRLRAQLSHPDGIRGFMVTFLTTTSSTSTDESDGHGNEKDSDEGIPPALIKAVIERIDPMSDSNELISLMCMNVIMPTGMITMHSNEEMSQQSAATAQRAIQLLKAVLMKCSDDKESEIRTAIRLQCHAIYAVATETTDNAVTNEEDERRQEYWRKFFQKWGYQSQQRFDIAKAINSVLSYEE